MIRLRLMTFADLELGLRLRQQAGWNQTSADWARYLCHQPDGCFVAEKDGVACGTVTSWIFGEVAWVATMLVEKELRGQGIGRALMEHVLAYLEAKHVRSVRLDASAMGEPLYRRLGFVEQFTLGRFEGEPFASPGVGVESGTPDTWEAVVRLDQSVTNTDRRSLLLPLFRERAGEVHVMRRGGAVIGFLTARRGQSAWRIGPCIATSEAGPPLLGDALHRFTGRSVCLDIPLPHEPAIAVVTRAGLRQQRTLLRMCRGELLTERVSQLWASSGPEKG
jgi:GNAT superfamily N-acetyltransferase